MEIELDLSIVYMGMEWHDPPPRVCVWKNVAAQQRTTSDQRFAFYNHCGIRSLLRQNLSFYLHFYICLFLRFNWIRTVHLVVEEIQWNGMAWNEMRVFGQFVLLLVKGVCRFQ